MKNSKCSKANASIAKMLAAAQVASDRGKESLSHKDYKVHKELYDYLYEIDRSLALYAYRGEYDAKDEIMPKIIEKIRCGGSDFRYYVVRDGVRATYLVYFQVKVNGKVKQVSFHSFERSLHKYLSNKEKMHMRWDKKDSRKTCIYLLGRF